ncbi:MAG: beta-Ala-His dipeptidase [Planctomycetes bacterium]|nr:beta-Ala-His dipeptidase [Planctomycetota bacterium]
MQTIETLQPQVVWKIFSGIAGVPRASKKEQRVRAHVRAFVEQHGLNAVEDRAGNLIVRVPASAGCENAPITILQAHLDMVCEKNTDTVFDFDTQGIRMRVESDRESGEPVVRAEGTTLGADNGIGVAMALAAAVSPELRRGPLELLLTVDEEAGMSGAKGLDASLLHGRRLLNLDSEEDDALYIGCAGGSDNSLIWEVPLLGAAEAQAATVSISGLRGGHSGTEIHLNRGSAVKLLARLLRTCDDVRIAALAAGSKRNAIPREARATVCGPAGLLDTLRTQAVRLQQEASSNNGEKECRIRVEPAPPAALAISSGSARTLLRTVLGLPHGVQAVIPDIPGMVETSNSVSTIQAAAEDGNLRVVVGCLSRSSSMAALASLGEQIRAVGELAGATVQQGNSYPGWQPNAKSPTLAVCRRVYERLFGGAPHVAAIHAGLECGLLGERVPGLDMVSFGPHITGPHSPAEQVFIRSVEKSWNYLRAVLAEIAS